MNAQAKPLRRPAGRSRAAATVPGVLCMSQMRPICDICNRSRASGNHAACSRTLQAKYRPLWEAVQ